MTIYILRYASDGDTSHINEGFRSIAAAKKRFNALKREAKEQAEAYHSGATPFETLPIDMFDSPMNHYLRKVEVNNLSDLIRLVNYL